MRDIKEFIDIDKIRNFKITKNNYLAAFACIVMVLALVRCIFPSVAEPRNGDVIADADTTQVVSNDTENAKEQELKVAEEAANTELAKENKENAKKEAAEKSVSDAKTASAASIDTIVPIPTGKKTRFFNADGTPVKNRITSVPSYARAFPDQNDVQLISANKYGVQPVQNRTEAENRKAELVYVGSNPYFFVDPLRNSIPYLVPEALNLLQDIGKNFFDSLQTKQVPLHKIIVTSVLRTKDDVTKLRGHNGNATENSCHLYGTTFDICYNRYKTVSPPNEQRRAVRNDTLKWVLSEVLNDLRMQKRCYIKYEVHQGCFHITVR